MAADRIELADLHRLDHELRRELPGSQDWNSSPAQFAQATVASPFFDPATSLVAVHDNGEHAGLVRIQGARRQPRLLLLGVRPAHRRRGLARALLAAAFAPLHERGVATVAAEADLTNTPALRLLESLAAERTGRAIELVRRP